MSDGQADPLLEQAEVREQPFTSETPLLGPLIVWFRNAWNSVAAKWYVRGILQQQNNRNRELAGQLRQAEARLAELDRNNQALTREVAELSAQVARLKAAQRDSNDAES